MNYDNERKIKRKESHLIRNLFFLLFTLIILSAIFYSLFPIIKKKITSSKQTKQENKKPTSEKKRDRDLPFWLKPKKTNLQIQEKVQKILGKVEKDGEYSDNIHIWKELISFFKTEETVKKHNIENTIFPEGEVFNIVYSEIKKTRLKPIDPRSFAEKFLKEKNLDLSKLGCSNDNLLIWEINNYTDEEGEGFLITKKSHFNYFLEEIKNENKFKKNKGVVYFLASLISRDDEDLSQSINLLEVFYLSEMFFNNHSFSIFSNLPEDENKNFNFQLNLCFLLSKMLVLSINEAYQKEEPNSSINIIFLRDKAGAVEIEEIKETNIENAYGLETIPFVETHKTPQETLMKMLWKNKVKVYSYAVFPLKNLQIKDNKSSSWIFLLSLQTNSRGENVLNISCVDKEIFSSLCC